MRQHRVCLESGLQLDINDLIRRGYLKPGAAADWARLDWRNEAGDRIAVAAIRADMRSPANAWLEVQQLLTADLRQRFALVTRPRHFGGWQWLFQCPDTGRLVMKLYWPPDMHRFASRQSWGAHRVAYRSQFLWRTGRAHLAQDRIMARLCAAGGFDPNGPEARMLRRPKRMRSRTYRRLEEKLYRHDAVLSERFRRK